ncbi:NADase-type glycan-binding domain-containing protein [Streptomyces avermitilis]|uniref:NADase-type glycan-binding domain-containing protein n=1 Tax=Streptomyces avermitilis TaxID=33903 RepID=UPI0036944A35
MTSQTPGTGQEPVPVCADCGTRAEPGQSFCDSCGAVLDWAGAAAPAAAPVAAARTGGARAGAAAVGAAEESAPAGGRGGRSREAAASAGRPGGAPGTQETGGAPEWDAFAHPGAGTGTARTGHDSAGGRAEPDIAPDADAPDAAAPAGQDSRRTDAESDSGSPSSHAPHAPGATAADAARPHAAAPLAGATSVTDRHGGTMPPAPDLVPEEPDRSDRSDRSDEADTESLPTSEPAAPGDFAAERARSLLVPVADPEPAAAPSVAPVLPGLPVANRPQVRTPVSQAGEAGGVPCPWCGTPNRPDRHYCTRCASSMAGGRPTAERLPWWRRLLNSRNGQPPWAGDRPRLRRGFGRVLNWVVGALVLTLLVFAVMNTGKAVGAVRDHFAKRAQVSPDSVKASRSYTGHGAGLAFDKLNNTWWGPGVSQSGKGEWLEARFDEPTRLLDIMITSGVSTHADQLTQSALPHRVEARITTKDGKTTTRDLVLDQSAGGQRRAFRAADVIAVRFTIRSSYGATADKQVSIAEIEFFKPSSGSAS